MKDVFVLCRCVFMMKLCFWVVRRISNDGACNSLIQECSPQNFDCRRYVTSSSNPKDVHLYQSPLIVVHNNYGSLHFAIWWWIWCMNRMLKYKVYNLWLTPIGQIAFCIDVDYNIAKVLWQPYFIYTTQYCVKWDWFCFSMLHFNLVTHNLH